MLQEPFKRNSPEEVQDDLVYSEVYSELDGIQTRSSNGSNEEEYSYSRSSYSPVRTQQCGICQQCKRVAYVAGGD